MNPDQILLVVLPIVWVFTLIMAYKVGQVHGEFDEFERLTRLHGACADEYGGVEN